MLKNKFKKLIKNIFLLNNKKIEFKEYIQKKDTYEKDIFEVLTFLLNKEINETKILEEIKNLNQESKINLIDYVIQIKNPDFICYSNEPDINIKVIETLSKEIYYRESVIKKIKEYNNRIIFRSPCVYIFKSLEV